MFPGNNAVERKLYLRILFTNARLAWRKYKNITFDLTIIDTKQRNLQDGAYWYG